MTWTAHDDAIETLNHLECQRDRIASNLASARYWLGVTQANNDGTALHAALLAERRNKVDRLEAELAAKDAAIAGDDAAGSIWS